MDRYIDNSFSWSRAFLDFLFPPLCLGCGRFNKSRIDICDDCLKAIDKFQYPFCLNCSKEIIDEIKCNICGEEAFILFAWGNYIDPLKQIIIQYKFKDITTPAILIAGAVCLKYKDRLERLKADLLVPIPLHPGREYFRGYNQATLFARQLEEKLGIPAEDTILFRVKKRKPQSRLNEYQRKRNIKGVFKVADEPDIPADKRRIILVDDVVTSGATVSEARKTLESAGFKVVGVIAMAHGL